MKTQGFISLGIGLAGIFVWPGNAPAVSRAPVEPLAERVKKAEVVFVGTLVDRVEEGEWVRATLRVDVPLRGVAEDEWVPVIWRKQLGEFAIYDASENDRGIAILDAKHEGRFWLRADKFEPVGKLEEVNAMLEIGVPAQADAPPGRNAALAALPKVLLIGDSISGGYLGDVRTQLKDEAHVERGNSGGTTIAGLEGIDEILGDTDWDVIHFNWGLHDMTWQRRMKPEERGIEAYAARLEQLVKRLTRTKARLIWATTTPWPEETYAYYENRFGERLVYSPEEERQWRDAALAVMKKHDIPVNDLYALLKPALGEYQNPDDVHFNREGSRAMARQIAAVIRPLLTDRDAAAE